MELAENKVHGSRQFANSQTQGRGDAVLGVKGSTPRKPKRLAEWGIAIHQGLESAPWPNSAVRAVALIQAESLATAHREFVDAVEAVEQAKAREASAQAHLEDAREDFDAESAKGEREPHRRTENRFRTRESAGGHSENRCCPVSGSSGDRRC